MSRQYKRASGGSADLPRVAALLGIETRFTDALGTVREVSDDALAALIACFGLPHRPGRAAEAIAEERRAAPLGLDPAHIVAAEDPRPGLLLRLPGGEAVEWHCELEDGERRDGRTETIRTVGGAAERTWLPLPPGLPLGYHGLELSAGGVAARTSLIVAPATCYLPPALGPGERSWGLTTQLYSLRSLRNWGIGDFTDLANLCRAAGGCGAALVGVNPLHALFAAEPRHLSPYSPSSRSYLDYLYIDVTAVPGFAEDETARALAAAENFAAARAARFVDHRAVAALKRPVLEALFARFSRDEFAAGGAPRGVCGAEFRRFQEAGGGGLAAFATFEALHEHYCRDGRSFSWRKWPVAMRDPGSAAVSKFAAAHRDRVAFFEFLQWQADRQLAAAAEAGYNNGLSLGIYRDLAVGVDPNGAEAWAEADLLASGASIGAPPDALSRAGQNWGLAPVDPLGLRRRGFAPFVAALRANMRHAGVLRIDHVMLLKRLYWIPSGAPATDGAYVNYPFDDLLRLVALESQRQRCAVVGEDLGTVPEGFRAALQAAQLLSYRIVAFEREGERRLRRPAEYPPLAAASAATHDMPTIKGFWLGRDIAWRRRLGLYRDADAEAADLALRRRDRELILKALAEEGLLAPDRFSEFLSADGVPIYAPVLRDAILVFLARSRSRLMLVQLEDVAGEAEQANLPGTTGAHPNWRRRMAQRLDEILAGPDLRRIAGLVAEGRRQSPRDPHSE